MDVVRYFRLTRASTYQWRSKASLAYYVFSGDTPVAVKDPRDQARFEKDTKTFVEVDAKGNLVVRDSVSKIPMAFTSKGMVPPKSYQKMAKSPSPIPVAPQAAPTPPAPRTVSSSNKTTEPAKVEEQKVVEPKAEEPKVEIPEAEKTMDSDATPAVVEESEATSEAGEPKSRGRIKKSRKRRKKSSGGDK